MTQREAGSELAHALHGEWPFTSRDAELDLITVLLGPTDGVPPRQQGAVVVAPAGVGKTRLLREVRGWAEARGLPTASVIATHAASRTPYGAVLHLLPDGLVDPADQVGWHGSFSARLRAGGRPTVVLVDDAQHLDQASAALLLQLTLDGAVTPVVTVRRGESVPDPITALWKEDLALRVDLQPLSTVEMGGLIRRAVRGPVSDRTVARLTAVSGGNVLYARELVMAAVERGSLQARDGVWMWDEEVVLAPRLVDAVWARLEALDPEQRQALAAVGVGEPLPLSVAEAMASTDVLSALEEVGLVSVDDSDGRGALRLGHPLYGEVLLARIGRIGRRRLVGSLAEAFDAADPREAEAALVRVVTWRLDAGRQQSRETLLDAAARANQVFAHTLAARLARAALEAGDDDPTERAAVVVELGRALVGCNRAEEALPLLTEVETAVLATADPQLVDDYVDVRFRAKYYGLGHAEEANDLLERVGSSAALAGDDGTPSREDRLAPYRATLAVGEGRPREALAIAEPLLDRSDLPAQHQLMLLETTGEALGQLGLHRRAEGVWERMRQFPVGATSRAAGAKAEADLQAVFSGMLDGRVMDVLPVLTAVHAAMADSPDVVNRGLACLGLGRCLLQAGRLERARAVLLDAVADFRKVDLADSLSWALTLLSQTESLVGRPEVARRRRDEAVGARRGSSAPARQAVDVVMADVWLKVAEGDRTAAAAIALAGAEQYPELELTRAGLLHLACMLGERGGEVTTTLRQIAERAECEYPTLLADHAAALRAGDRHALEEVAERFAERGLGPLAVDAATQAAAAHRAAGSGDGARRMAGRTQVLAERIDGGLTQTSVPQEPVIGLSRREQEVARLAAAGLSNAAIAQQLVVSVRTVESHLYQVFSKLGITARADLGRYLPPPNASR